METLSKTGLGVEDAFKIAFLTPYRTNYLSSLSKLPRILIMSTSRWNFYRSGICQGASQIITNGAKTMRTL